VIIYGSKSKGSTYNCVQLFKNYLRELTKVTFTEFTLPTHLPHICLGCFTCFKNGEDKCPHAEYVQPIATALREADGIILSSPVYACDVSGALKTLFDHLCYIWMTHRPMEEMFSKIGMVITTAAGAGAVTSIRTMKKNLKYWGVRRTLSFGGPIAATSWQEVSLKTKTEFERKLKSIAVKFNHLVTYRSKIHSKLFTKILFRLLGKMVTSYKEGSILERDKKYWEGKGWPDKNVPF